MDFLRKLTYRVSCFVRSSALPIGKGSKIEVKIDSAEEKQSDPPAEKKPGSNPSKPFPETHCTHVESMKSISKSSDGRTFL